ncbi:MAG: hypothetical protein WCP89_03380 [archaeon]
MKEEFLSKIMLNIRIAQSAKIDNGGIFLYVPVGLKKEEVSWVMKRLKEFGYDPICTIEISRRYRDAILISIS